MVKTEFCRWQAGRIAALEDAAKDAGERAGKMLVRGRMRAAKELGRFGRRCLRLAESIREQEQSRVDFVNEQIKGGR